MGMYKFVPSKSFLELPEEAVLGIKDYAVKGESYRRWKVFYTRKFMVESYVVVFTEKGFECSCGTGGEMLCEHQYAVLFGSAFEDYMGALILLMYPHLKGILKVKYIEEV